MLSAGMRHHLHTAPFWAVERLPDGLNMLCAGSFRVITGGGDDPARNALLSLPCAILLPLGFHGFKLTHGCPRRRAVICFSIEWKQPSGWGCCCYGPSRYMSSPFGHPQLIRHLRRPRTCTHSTSAPTSLSSYRRAPCRASSRSLRSTSTTPHAALRLHYNVFVRTPGPQDIR